MFRQLPLRLTPVPISLPAPDALERIGKLFRKHPLDLVAYMETYWNGRYNLNKTKRAFPCDEDKRFGFPLGHPYHLSDEPAMFRLPLPDDETLVPVPGKAGLPTITDDNKEFTPCPRLRSDHLIYAYMIENTRVYEIFRRVLHEHLHGEKFGAPLDEDSQHWLRNTEELFYRDSAPFLITNVSSHIRSDLRANRRNAYQSMFGMDLNHGADDGKPYAYVKAEAANSAFVTTFEEFLREVWVGITYVSATSSSKPTDDAKIADLAVKLFNMLQSRRLSGNLAREEFAFVSMMSWFHLTLEFDSPIVKSLRAEASGAENRLFKIAERVGLPAHGLSKSFFDIADPISRLLIFLETDVLINAGTSAVPAFYQAGPIQEDILNIINHWSLTTGRDLKVRRAQAAPRAAVPV